MSRIPPSTTSASPNSQDDFNTKVETKHLTSDPKKRSYGTFDPHSEPASALKGKIDSSPNSSASKQPSLQSRRPETVNPKRKELQSKAAGDADGIKEGELSKSDQDKINEITQSNDEFIKHFQRTGPQI